MRRFVLLLLLLPVPLASQVRILMPVVLKDANRKAVSDLMKEMDWIPVKINVNRPGLTVRAAPGFLGLKPAKTH